MTVVVAEQYRLLELAEEALVQAVSGAGATERRAARALVLNDGLYARWRAHFRRLLVPVAAARSDREKLSQLRRLASGCEHDRILIDHLRRSGVTGDARTRLFELLYPGVDYETAVIREHRRYRLAVGGQLAATGLLRRHGDVAAVDLLDRYRAKYARYFTLYCQWLCLGRGVYADMVRSAMLDANHEAEAWRARLLAAPSRMAPARRLPVHIAAWRRPPAEQPEITPRARRH